jgi:hypothetical protein
MLEVSVMFWPPSPRQTPQYQLDSKEIGWAPEEVWMMYQSGIKHRSTIPQSITLLAEPFQLTHFSHKQGVVQFEILMTANEDTYLLGCCTV